jgi:hypothetical protein
MTSITQICQSSTNGPQWLAIDGTAGKLTYVEEELLDWVFEVFEQNPEFQRKNITKPLFSDQKTFNVLASNLSSLSQGVLVDALGSIIPFSGQLYISKDFKNDKMSFTLKSYRAPKAEKLIKQTAQQLIISKWGCE